MKNILKGTIIFAVCLTLAACGTGSPQDITVQSITEPMVTMQTVGNVPEVTAVTESTLVTVRATGTEEWVEPVATEPNDTYNNSAETLAGMMFPETMVDREQSYIIQDLFYQGLPDYSWSEHEKGFSDYDECYECYKKLLVEKFLDDPDAFELFGGAYWCNGWLFLRITDYSKKDDIFSDIFDNLESVEVTECKYSYSDLLDVWETVQQNEKAAGHLINVENNCVEVLGAFTDEDKENILADLEAAGFDADAVVIDVIDATVMNPC